MPKDIGIKLSLDQQQAVSGSNEIIKSMGGISRAVKQVTADGADTETIWKKIGEAGGAEFQEKIRLMQQQGASLREIQKAVQELAAAETKAARQAKAELLEQIRTEAALEQQVNQRAQGLRDGVAQVHDSIAPLKEALQEAGKQALTLQRNLLIAFKGDPEAAKQAEEGIKRIRIATGATDDELLRGTQTLQKYGQYSEENLNRASLAAKRTGQSVDEIAAALGRFEKFQDTRSANRLKGVLGLDPEEIARASGLLDEHGKVLLDTADKRERFTNAVNAALDKANGNLHDLTSEAQKTRTEFEELQKEVGIGMVKAQNDMVASARPVVEALRDMPEAVKGAAGQFVNFASSATGVVTSSLQMAANIKQAGLSLAAFTTPLGVAAIGLGAIAAAVALMTTAQQTQNEHNENNIKEWEKFNTVLRDHHALLVKIAQGGTGAKQDVSAIENAQLGEQAMLLKEITKLQANLDAYKGNQKLAGEMGVDIAALQTELDLKRQQLEITARQAANTERAKQQAQGWGNIISEVSLAQGKAQEAAADKAATHSIEAWNNFKQRRIEGVYETKAAELNAINEVVAQLQKAKPGHANVAKDLAKAQQEQTKLAKEVGKEEIAQRIKLAEQRVEIDQASGKITTQQAAERYATLAKMAGLNAEQMGTFELKSAQEHKKALDEKEKDDKKYEDDRIKALDQRLKHDLDLMKANVDAHKASLKDLADLLEKQAKTPGLDENKRAEKVKEAADVRKEITDKQLSDEKELAKVNEQNLEKQIKLLEEKATKEEGDEAKLRELIAKRAELERKAIEDDFAAQKAKYGDTATLEALRKAKLDELAQATKNELFDVHKKITEELKKQNDEAQKLLDKQREAQNFHKGAQSIGDAFKNGNFDFNLGLNPDAAHPSSPDADAPPGTTSEASSADPGAATAASGAAAGAAADAARAALGFGGRIGPVDDDPFKTIAPRAAAAPDPFNTTINPTAPDKFGKAADAHLTSAQSLNKAATSLDAAADRLNKMLGNHGNHSSLQDSIHFSN